MRANSLGSTLHLRGKLVTGVSTAVAITACHVLQGVCLALAIAAVLPPMQGGASDALSLSASPYPWLLALAGIVLLRGWLLWRAEIAAQATAQAVKQELRGQLLTHLLDLGPGVTLRRQTGDLQATIVGGVEAVESYYSRYLPAVRGAAIGCAVVLATLAVVDWRSAVLLGIFVVAFPLLDRFWMRWQMPTVSGVFAAMGAFGAELLDSLQGILTLKAFNASDAWRHRLAARASELRVESMRAITVTMMRTGRPGRSVKVGWMLRLRRVISCPT